MRGINLESGGRRQSGARIRPICGLRKAPAARRHLGPRRGRTYAGRFPHASEPDPRTPQLRPRRPDPAAVHRCPRPRPGPGRAHARRRLRLRARAVRGRRGAGRLGDDLRSAVQDGRDGGRLAAGRRADARPAAAGDLGRDRRAARTSSGRCGAPPPARGSRSPSSACSTSCRRPGSTPRRSRPAAGTLEGSAYLSDLATPVRRLRRGARPPRPGRLARGSPARRSRCCAIRRVLGGAPGLPLRARRPDPQPVRADRGALARSPR